MNEEIKNTKELIDDIERHEAKGWAVWAETTPADMKFCYLSDSHGGSIQVMYHILKNQLAIMEYVNTNEIPDIKKFALRDNEKLIITYPVNLSKIQHEILSEELNRKFPEYKGRIIIFEGNPTFKVIENQ